MALIDIKKLKKEASKAANNVGKGIGSAASSVCKGVATAASNVADTVSGVAKNVGDSASEFGTNLILKLLKGLDVDAILKATETYGRQSGKNVSATVKFLNNLKSLRDGKQD